MSRKQQASCVAGLGIAELKDVTLEEFATNEKLKQRYERAIQSATQFCG